MTRATTHATGPYNVPNAKIDCFAMYTNNPPIGAFRGFGVTQSAFAVEQNMDMVAEELGIDPVEFRRINAQKVGVTTATGQLLRESVGLLDTLDLCEKDMRGGLNGSFRWAWREGDLAYGWGVAAPTRTPAWAAARRIARMPRSRPSRTARSKCAPRRRTWGRAWSACWRSAPPKNLDSHTDRCASCSATPI